MANPKSPPAIRACLFDMDGLLIDSEDWYTHCTNQVLNEYGRPNLPWNIKGIEIPSVEISGERGSLIKAQLQGRPGGAASQILADWAQLPISRDEYMAKLHVLQKKHFPQCKPLPGVPELLATLGKETDVKIALATSSHQINFKLKTDHMTELFEVFQEEYRVLGDDKRIPPGRGKPAPDIYLLALETINAQLRSKNEPEIKPAECLVFEDSVPGVESGRRAGMQVVWCPHPGLLNEYRGREESVLAGLTGEYKESEEKNATLGVVTPDGAERKARAPGAIGDGLGRFLPSLESFPYQDYGIHVKDGGKI